MRKLMILVIGFTLAILFFASEYHTLLLLALAFATGLGIYWHYGKNLQSLLWILGGFLFGMGYFTWYHAIFYAPLTEYHGEVVEVQGEVLDFPLWETYSYSMLVELELGGSKVKTLLYLDSQGKNLEPGDEFSTFAALYSGQETFSGEEITYYSAKGILLRAVAEGDLEIQAKTGVMLRHLPSYLAHWLKEGIFSVFTTRYSGVIQALVTGNRENLSDDFSSSLQRTGLSHTVAVSGMHLAFLAGMLRLFLPKGWKITPFLVISLMITFMLVSGSTPSVMRATAMIVLLQIAPLFGRERDDGTALATAVFLILLQNPYAINHVGLHLSVLSVAGILIFADKIQEIIARILHYDWEFGPLSLKKVVLTSISATVSAMIFTTPLVAYYFGSISLIAPLSNLLTLWAVSVAFAVGLICGLCGIFSTFLGYLISLPLIPVLEYLLWIVPALSRNPLAAIGMDSFYYRNFLIFAYVLLFLAIFLPGQKKLPLTFAMSCLGFFLAFTLHRLSYFQGELSFVVFDVGQGQSILFTVGDTLILSDCGGNSSQNVGDMVADNIQSLGRSHLELLVLSHCHADHANGVVQLMNRVQVQTIAMPIPDTENSIQMAILQKAQEEGTEIWFIEEETQVLLEETGEIRLFPPLGQGDANEEGITLLVTVGETDVLLTGDMGSEVEELLVETFELPDIEVFVVGHHGSKFSTSQLFLEAIQAEIAIISVSGKNNYGHPSAEVLWKLHLEDFVVYRTDLNGHMWFRAAG